MPRLRSCGDAAASVLRCLSSLFRRNTWRELLILPTGVGVLERGYTVVGVPMESKLGTQLYYCPKNYVVGDR
jgi:hypothetical protein